MKVAFLTKSLSRQAGGLLPVMQRLGQVLSAHRSAEILTLGIYDAAFDQDVAGWQSVATKVFRSLGPHALGYSPEMFSALAEINPDIVHTHGLFCYTSAIACDWGRSSGKPYIISPHGMLDPWALQNSRWKKLIAAWLFENRHLSHSGCIHSLCTAETQAIRQYGLRQKPISQIPNGIDLPDNTPDMSPPWPVEKGRKVLLYLSRIHPKKGLANLVPAWSAVKSDTPASQDWILAIAGWDQGGHESELKALVAELDLGDDILFLGPQFNEGKAACYQNASGFILPSFSEGLPMVILEAWAYGLPVLMTPQCNIPEGFSANAALRIEPEAGSIEQGLRDFFLMPDNERLAMGERGRKLVEERFTWDKVADDMYAVYQWLLGGGQPPACVITD